MTYDLFIIGGGVNGAGIARDAAGRGLKVGLCERDDLAAHTSSASTKLIHGGLRYLEHYEFRLVREALIEREVLLRAAPHIIWPMRFVLPHHKGLRPAWLLRLGLFLYDHLGGRELLPATKRVDLAGPPFGGPLAPEFRFGFAYSDCWVEDARLVVLNAVDAARRGADILTRTECVGLARTDDEWAVSLKSAGGGVREVRARVLVNAAGPWVDDIDRRFAPGRNATTVRLIKGSHIIVPKLFNGEHAYIFQNTDGRVVFAIPYEGEFTLIGTTDVPVQSPSEAGTITPEETAYLCELASSYFKTPVTSDQVVWSYAGARPLFDDDEDDASKITRDYTLKLDQEGAPVLSIYGGKITTFRKLAEHALAKLEGFFPDLGASWTATAALPGGDIPNADFEGFATALVAERANMPPALLRRLARAYGTETLTLLGEAKDTADLGRSFGAGLFERELVYLAENEFAASADDVLWRRSKLGLRLSDAERRDVAAWFGGAPRTMQS
ncbi:MAG: glycerol-3-phosphate dehydrogenase [Pseudomonadota bacterium]